MPGDPTHRPVVLIVVGEPALAEWLAAPLQAAFEVRRAYDGTQANELVDADVDVVLLDPATPGFGYKRFVDRLRRRGIDSRIALVLDPEADTTAIGAEVDDYVTRPALGETVPEVVRRLAEVAKYDRDLREFFELASRKAQLEAQLSMEALEKNSEYADLLAELYGYRDLLDLELRNLDENCTAMVFRERVAV